MRIGAGAESTQLSLDGSRRLSIPTTLKLHRAPVDAPMNAFVRFRFGSQWEYCSFNLELEHRTTYQRAHCSTGTLTELSLVEARLEAVMPAGDGSLEAALQEPAPCAGSPKSVDGKTVIEGGRFFSGSKPKEHWFAVMDEAVVPAEQVAAAAEQLAAQFGVTLGLLTHGPYGFEFFGSATKALSLANDVRVRFVEEMVHYRGAGWSTDQIPVPGQPSSWALDRLDQRESNAELTGFAAGDQGKDHRFRYPETTAPLGTRPQLWVVDTRARTSHAVFSELTEAVRVPVAGSNPQCRLGGGAPQSHHGTSVLSSLLGRAGTMRIEPRAAFVVEGLGLAGGNCDQATQAQVVAALREVAVAGRARDILVLSFGSDRFSMATEMSVNALALMGILVFAATGNESRAALYPPASAAEALAIGAVQDTGLDDKWPSSNGLASNVDFHAPGVSVETASDESDTATRVGNGTSLATPLVAGIATCHLINGGIVGPPDQLRGLVRAALTETARLRTGTQLVLPFTPTQPIVGVLRPLTSTMLLAESAYDGESAWLAGLHAGASGASLVRLPVVMGEPSSTGVEVLRSGVGSRCLGVMATADGATVGCWSPSSGGQLLHYQVSGASTTEVASFDIAGVPVAVAADVEPSTTSFANTNVRAALSLPVLTVNGTTPELGTVMALTVARRGVSAWQLSSVDLPGPSSAFSRLALNCPRVAFAQGSACDAFALVTHPNASRVRLYRVSFSADPTAPLPAPVLLAERVDSGPFFTCFVPGWSSGEGLVATTLSVDDVMVGSTSASRWSFSFNRLGTGFINGQCAFDHTSVVVNDASPMLDVVGARGEAWTAATRGAFSRTTLAVASVWDPTTSSVRAGLRSTIRSLHPRGRGQLEPDVRAVAHATYGDDAMALTSPDGTTWSIQSLKP